MNADGYADGALEKVVGNVQACSESIDEKADVSVYFLNNLLDTVNSSFCFSSTLEMAFSFDEGIGERGEYW